MWALKIQTLSRPATHQRPTERGEVTHSRLNCASAGQTTSGTDQARFAEETAWNICCQENKGQAARGQTLTSAIGTTAATVPQMASTGQALAALVVAAVGLALFFVQDFRSQEIFVRGVEPGSESYGAGSTDILVFAHLSDLHLNDRHITRESRFRGILRNVLPVVRPYFVMVTGDIADSMKSTFVSGPDVTAWKRYAAVLEEYRINKARWLDTPGNHDTFAVSSPSDSKFYFKQFSVSKEVTPRSWLFCTLNGQRLRLISSMWPSLSPFSCAALSSVSSLMMSAWVDQFQP